MSFAITAAVATTVTAGAAIYGAVQQDKAAKKADKQQKKMEKRQKQEMQKLEAQEREQGILEENVKKRNEDLRGQKARAGGKSGRAGTIITGMTGTDDTGSTIGGVKNKTSIIGR